MPKDRRIIRVDAATNLAAFALNGEVLAKLFIEFNEKGDPELVVETAIPIVVYED